MRRFEKFVSGGGYVTLDSTPYGRLVLAAGERPSVASPVALEAEEQAELAIVLLRDLADRASEPMQQRVLRAAIDSVDRELTRAVFPNQQAKETSK